ncbi:hypothetical protein ANMWB30_22960 [Arthrobacter sp. MWB30]|nr:hypothetical protein ANMWB30_22960 [Arthrobacter sp. MWB30]
MNTSAPTEPATARGSATNPTIDSTRRLTTAAHDIRESLSRGSAPATIIDLFVALYLSRTWGAGKWSLFLQSENIRVPGLPPDERVVYVRGLHNGGLSIRSIAAVLNVSYETARTDCKNLGLSGRVIGVNGRHYTPLPTWHIDASSNTTLHLLATAEKAMNQALQTLDASPCTRTTTELTQRLARISALADSLNQHRASAPTTVGGSQ